MMLAKQLMIAKCKWCKQDHELQIDPKDLQDVKEGKHIQDAMPYLNADEREILISGTCGKCFDEMFGGDE